VTSLPLSHATTSPSSAGEETVWQARGLCRFMPPELWEHDRLPGHPEALRLCLACPVKTECVNAALIEATKISGDFLIRGATTPWQRELIRRGTVTIPTMWERSAATVARHDEEVYQKILPAMSNEATHRGQQVAA